MTDEKSILQFLLEFLPEELTEIYIPEKILAINRHNTIVLLSSKESENKFVLKILEKDYYDTKLSKSLNALSDQNLLLPLQTDIDMYYVYLLYPQRTTLSDVLLQKGLNYQMLRRLIHEIGNAIAALHQYNILHLDITPGNIFLDQKDHFYLGDFSSSRIAKNNFFSHFFCKCLHTGTTPVFAPENSNDISFWNDQYSFSLLLYILLNNGNLPVKENTKKHSIFPSTNHVLQKAIEPPSAISKEMFSHFLLELENSLQKDEEFFHCKNYQIQFIETDQIICKSVTPDCVTRTENKVKIRSSSSPQLQIPIPFYGLLICCGFLFLFSFYHYITNSTTHTSDSIKEAYLNTASLPSPHNVEKTEVPEVTTSILSDLPKITSSNIPDLSTETDSDDVKDDTKRIYNFSAQDHILNISNSNYHNKKFLKNSMKPKSIHILFANSCQFTNSNPFSDLTNLKELYLYNNPLIHINTLSKLENLEILVLSKCKLNDISCLAKLETLTILDLSQNKNLMGITSLSSLKKLNYLIITHTNISQKDIHFLQKELPHCTILF